MQHISFEKKQCTSLSVQSGLSAREKRETNAARCGTLLWLGTTETVFTETKPVYNFQ